MDEEQFAPVTVTLAEHGATDGTVSVGHLSRMKGRNTQHELASARTVLAGLGLLPGLHPHPQERHPEYKEGQRDCPVLRREPQSDCQGEEYGTENGVRATFILRISHDSTLAIWATRCIRRKAEIR